MIKPGNYTVAGKINKIDIVKKVIGLVVCGGKSSRMGIDKSLIDYHGKPQHYHVFEMLENICEKVFISCNSSQLKGIELKYLTLPDLPEYDNIGPMAALLTAFTAYPDQNFLLIGCDYPFINEQEIMNFLLTTQKNYVAAAFYNKEHSVYEPLLAWYSHQSKIEIQRMFENKQFSLQHFLKKSEAEQYAPVRLESIKSIDTPEDYEIAKAFINSTKNMP